ncbi:serine O-acetyltransferase [Pragia fontium]|uniref:serine O-acetyltransferase n=1 Tax=Pragia fontium TaxID=82985 RepID=UPI00215D7B38|nr:serine acetyltransferase [Pragia fontium]
MVSKDEELAHLKKCLQKEVIKNTGAFSWISVIHKALKCPDRRFNFWWRIANYLHHVSNGQSIIAKRINWNLRIKYGVEVELGAVIKEGLSLVHRVGIVISRHSVIGTNFHVLQNVTVGVVIREGDKTPSIVIGDNVTVGANSCIIGSDITIGDNVAIGAMSFINKSIPSDCTVYTPKMNNIVKIKNHHNKLRYFTLLVLPRRDG